MRSRKKGSLSLSINAIVILVLAISMLGLGLGFTKSMFAKFGSKLDVPPPNIPATEDEPIVLPSDTVKAKIGKDLTFSVNIYNDQILQATPNPTLSCMKSGAGQTPPGLVINAQAQANAVFYIPGAQLQIPGLDICTISAQIGTKTITKQISLDIS